MRIARVVYALALVLVASMLIVAQAREGPPQTAVAAQATEGHYIVQNQIAGVQFRVQSDTSAIKEQGTTGDNRAALFNCNCEVGQPGRGLQTPRLVLRL